MATRTITVGLPPGVVTEDDLATVATTGDYSDLSGKPTIPDSAADIGAAATSHTHTGTQVTVDASGFDGNLWRVVQAHTTQADWTPDKVL